MAYDKNNVFAKILRGEISSKKIYEDDHAYAFEDISAAAPTHVLVVPKGEYVSYDDFLQNTSDIQIATFFRTVRKVAKQLGVDKSGYRLITNHGADASQSVPHFHVHILGGKPMGGLLPNDKATR